MPRTCRVGNPKKSGELGIVRSTGEWTRLLVPTNILRGDHLFFVEDGEYAVHHVVDERVMQCLRMGGCTVLRNLSESIPIGVACTNQHCAVYDGEDMNLVVGMLIDDAIWTALSLAEAVIIRGKSPETFFWYPVAEFWKRREQSRGLTKVSVPSAGNLSRLLAEYEPNNAHALGMGVFVRHVDDESVVWCPRTGGCTVLRNAQPILEEMKREWRNVDDIVRAVTAKFECCVDEVREGVEAVVGELASQRFVAVEVIGES